MKRYISTSFWDDEWVQTLTFTEKGLYLYLLTNPLTNIAGVYKLADRRIVFDTGLEEKEVRMIMDKFEAAGKAYRYGEFVVLPSWPHHQKCQNANIQKGISRILKTLDSEVIAFLRKVGYRYPLTEFTDTASASGNTVGLDMADSSISEEQRLFIRLWQTTKDSNGMCIFPVTARIERPKDWERFWQVSPPTCGQIETAFRNYADGVNCGAVPRKFIPRSPDRFALTGGISKFQTPAEAPAKKPSASPLAGKIRL
ncbi:MAG: hypothetical protein II837_10370 [Treponema sp.]|nr:hypothetical protein [Treponema sp.]